MIDKIEMRTKEQVNFNSLSTIFQNQQINIIRDSLYKNCAIIREEGKELITFKANPVWGDVYESKIIINPTKWESFSKICLILSKLCNINNLEIIRIDHAVDVALPINHIYSGIRIKYKTDRGVFKEDCSFKGKFLTGFNIGQKPELYCIYDKGYQLVTKKLKRDVAFEKGTATRIELRQFKSKIKYSHLSELVNYLDNPPFRGIEFYEISHESEKAQALAILMNRDGLSKVRADLNGNNNFDRNFKKYLTPIGLQETLNQKYQEELRQFLGIT